MNIETHFAPLLDLLVKSGAIILIGTALVAALRRSSAANRHAVSVTVFAALLLLPFTKLMPARWSFSIEKPTAPPVSVRLPLLEAAPAVESALPVQPVENVAQPVRRAARAPLVIPWKKLAVTVWLTGAALLLARRALIGLRLRSIVRRSFPIEDERLAAKVHALVEAGGVRAEVRESEHCRVPLASGMVRPVVLLPAEAADWSDAFISSALRHELGHVRRRDCVTRLLADVLCAIYWVNPLVWFAARQMRLAQEQACDDLVLNSGAPADEYAGQLVAVVRGLQGDRFTARHALAMAQPSTLESRVRAIVDTERDRSPRGLRATVVGCLSAALALALCLVTEVCGAAPDKTADKPADALRRGLAFLATKQRDDGSFGSGQFSGSIGVTGLAGLALMADDAHAQRVAKVAQFIQSAQGNDGFIAGKSMYDHGYATLFLAEYFKASPRADVKESLTKAVALIVKSQGKTGGWRYTPTPADGDTSVSACQMMALAGARNAGVDVPAATFTAGIGFLKRCQNPDGGFGYTLPGTSAFVRSAASLSASLATVNWTEPASRPDANKGADYVMAFLPKAGEAPKNVQYFVHGQYYASQALQLVGGDRWTRWRDAIRESLISSQMADGSWEDPISAELATSEACLILQGRKPVPATEKPERKTGAANHPGPLQIVSDKMTFDKKTGALSASGNVKIETAEATITAAQAEVTPKKSGAAAAATKIIFPQVDFRDAALTEVVGYLVEKSKHLDERGVGVNIVIRNAEKIGDAKITLNLSNVPLFELLRYVAELANCELVPEEFALVVGPKQAGKIHAQAAPAVPAQPAGVARKQADAVIFPRIDFREATLAECLEFLTVKSRALDADGKGANIVLRNADKIGDVKITLNLSHTPLAEVLRYVALLADCEVVREDFAFIVRAKQAGKSGAANAPAADAKAAGAAVKKAGTIRIPKLDLRDATLSETVEFLRAKAKALDPDGLGVNLILLPRADGKDPTITLSLNDVTLGEVIMEVTELAGFTCTADEHAITIRPETK